MEVKIDQKSIKKWSQHGKTSWDRFLMEFDGFLGPSWDGKTSQDRPRQIFGAPEARTKGGDPSTCENPPESFEKTMVFGGGAMHAGPRRVESWTP